MSRTDIVRALVFALACAHAEHPAVPAAAASHMTLKSPAFANNGAIPAKHTCDGANVSPPLTIAGVPAGAKSLALGTYTR